MWFRIARAMAALDFKAGQLQWVLPGDNHPTGTASTSSQSCGSVGKNLTTANILNLWLQQKVQLQRTTYPLNTTKLADTVYKQHSLPVMKEKYTKMHKTQRKITLTQINSTGPSENRCKTQKISVWLSACITDHWPTRQIINRTVTKWNYRPQSEDGHTVAQSGE